MASNFPRADALVFYFADVPFDPTSGKVDIDVPVYTPDWFQEFNAETLFRSLEVRLCLNPGFHLHAEPG